MILTMPDHWQDELRLFVAIVLMAGLAGALTGLLLVCLLLGLLVYLAWHLHQPNPAAGKLLGIAWPESQGRLLSSLAPDPVLREFLETGDFTRPLVIGSPTDRTKILSVFITPLKHETDRLMIVAQDITRRYHLDSARRDFVANVSHELRTPLTVISGLAEQLNMDTPDPDTLPHSTGLILQQAQRMNELVSDLLTLSRLEMQTPGNDYRGSTHPERSGTTCPATGYPFTGWIARQCKGTPHRLFQPRHQRRQAYP
jgi:signal transduction histidine kinase